jgi:hypothetical protein
LAEAAYYSAIFVGVFLARIGAADQLLASQRKGLNNFIPVKGERLGNIIYSLILFVVAAIFGTKVYAPGDAWGGLLIGFSMAKGPGTFLINHQANEKQV